MASLSFGGVFYSSATAYTGNNDNEKESNVGDTLGHCKGRLIYKGRLCAVKKLAKANLKRYMSKEYKGEEKTYEPIAKRLSRSKQLSSLARNSVAN